MLAAGGAGLRVLDLEGAVPVEGGVPLLVDGKIVGAIGCRETPVITTVNVPRQVRLA